MKRDLLDQIVLAVDEQTKRPPFDGKPWPLALMSIAGAWMIALPLIGLIGLLSFIVLRFSTSALYVIGCVMVVGAEAINRMYRRQALLEAILAPVLIAGLILGVAPLYFGSFSDRSLGWLVMTLAAVTLGGLTSVAWLRAPLGAFACYGSLGAWREYYSSPNVAFFALHASVGFWLAIIWFQKIFLHSSEVARGAARIEAVSNGWIAMVCLATIFSGQSFLISASLPFQDWASIRFDADPLGSYRVVSPLLSITAGAYLMRRWPTLRSWRFGVAVFAIALLGSLSFIQGILLLVTTVCLSRGKWSLAMLSAIAMAWDIGSTYYSTEFLLIWKAGAFAGVGAVLLVCSLPTCTIKHVLSLLSNQGRHETEKLRIHERRSSKYVIGAAGMIALTANLLVIQKEYVIEHSESIFIQLAPRDPRSLMAGDYMALRIAVSPDFGIDSYGARRAVLVRQGNGIGTFVEYYEGAPLDANEYPVEINFNHGVWTLGTNAWYFSEGDAVRWQRARYGEYRIDKRGRALLVGLRGPQLEKL